MLKLLIIPFLNRSPEASGLPEKHRTPKGAHLRQKKAKKYPRLLKATQTEEKGIFSESNPMINQFPYRPNSGNRGMFLVPLLLILIHKLIGFFKKLLTVKVGEVA